MISQRRNGTALRTVVDGPTYETGAHGAVPVIDPSAIFDVGTLQVFAVNRSVDQVAPLRIVLSGATLASAGEAELLTGPGPKAANAFGAPPVVAPCTFDGIGLRDGTAELELPPLSFVAASLRVA